jgi:hypothetical protein
MYHILQRTKERRIIDKHKVIGWQSNSFCVNNLHICENYQYFQAGLCQSAFGKTFETIDKMWNIVKLRYCSIKLRKCGLLATFAVFEIFQNKQSNTLDKNGII